MKSRVLGMRKWAVLLGFASFLVGTLAWAEAGPPLITDDTETPGTNRWEVNVAVTTESSHEESRLEAPVADINYGIGEHIELMYSVPWVVLGKADGASQSGMDRSECGIKWRFLDRERYGTSISIYPQYTFSTPVSDTIKNPALSDEQGSEILIPFEFGQQHGRFEFSEEVGYHIIQGDSNQLESGVAVSYLVRDGITVMSELHSDTVANFTASELVFNLGGIYDFSRHMSFLASVGRSLRTIEEDSAKTLAYTGVQFHL